MADRYQDRPFPAENDYDRNGRSRTPAKDQGDPLAELARLMGQTDPLSAMGRANLPVQPRAREHDRYDRQENYELPMEADDGPAQAPGPPSWMQRPVRQETPLPPQDYPSSTHPLHRYAATRAEPEVNDEHEPFADEYQEPDPARYDDALYGELEAGAADPQRDPVYADDAHAYRGTRGYQNDYADGEEEEPPRRRGGKVTVFAILALGVLGTGGAFAYRTYMGTARSGEPPIIRADTGPTKIVPAPADSTAKLPDRLSSGDGTEKIVSREEAPVDVNTRSGPRVVFPPVPPIGNPPSTASVSIAPPPASSGNGTLPNNEPRRIRTLAVKGDPTDPATTPVGATPPAAAAKPAPTAKSGAQAAAQRTASTANASATNGSAPLSLSPQTAPPQAASQQTAAPQVVPPPAAEPATRVASTNPTQVAPSAAPGGGGYLVQVSSQRSEADAQASFKALQGKFPAVLGSRAPVIKRADLGDKGIYYRAMVGPFGSPDEATQFCGSLKTAGGQCVVQRN
jgi:cell division protein FtsN